MLPAQRKVANAFLAAARDGDFDALVAVLDPDVVLRADVGSVLAGMSTQVHGAADVAKRALTFARLSRFAQPALVNGAAGFVTIVDGSPYAVMGLTVVRGRIAAIDILADPERLQQLDLALLGD